MKLPEMGNTLGMNGSAFWHPRIVDKQGSVKFENRVSNRDRRRADERESQKNRANPTR